MVLPVVSMRCSMSACAANTAGLDWRTLRYVLQHFEHQLQYFPVGFQPCNEDGCRRCSCGCPCDVQLHFEHQLQQFLWDSQLCNGQGCRRCS